jgi:hypothetical protein
MDNLQKTSLYSDTKSLPQTLIITLDISRKTRVVTWINCNVLNSMIIASYYRCTPGRLCRLSDKKLSILRKRRFRHSQCLKRYVPGILYFSQTMDKTQLSFNNNNNNNNNNNSAGKKPVRNVTRRK